MTRPLAVANVAILYFLLQVGRYRARRYRLGHTVWRGVRCDQTGSAFAYGLAAFGGMLVLSATLGLAKPWYDAMLFRRRWNNTWFGDQRFQADAGTKGLWWRWVVIYVVLGPMVAYWIDLFLEPLKHPVSDLGARMAVLIGILFALPVVAILAVAYPWYRVAQVRLFAGRITFSGKRLACSLRVRSILPVALAYGALMLGLLVFLVTFALPVSKNLGVAPNLSTLAGTILLAFYFVVAWAGHTVLYQGYVVPRVIMLACDSLLLVESESPGEIDFGAIRQGTRPALGMSEGLVGLLDVGGFV